MRQAAGSPHHQPRSAFLGFAVAAFLLLAPGALAQSLRVTGATNVVFPNRTVVLSVPPTVSLNGASVHVTENGRPVKKLSVTSLRQAKPGDLGVVLLIDTDPSMIGAPLDRAVAAARMLASQRSGAEELGVVFGNGVSLPLTSDTSTIAQALAHPPTGHTYRNLISMTQAAVGELSAAGIADRVIIYVTDDIDREAGYMPQSIGAYAQAAHVRIFTVGVRDAIWTRPLRGDLPSPASMRALATAGGGTYSEAVPAQERAAFLQIEAGLVSQYVVHYVSTQRNGMQIAVSIRVDGVPGVATFSYHSPSAPPVGSPTAHARHQSFWASSTAVVVVAVICGLLLGFAIALVVVHVTRAGQLRSRVQAFVRVPQELVVERPGEASKRVGFWARILERRRWWPTFVERVSISGFTKSPEELVRFAVAGSLLAAMLLDLITGSLLVAILGLAVGPLVLRAAVMRSVREQRLHFAEELSGQLHEIAGAMRTGRSIEEAVEIVADQADEPMRRELQRALADERAGLHLDDALLPIAERMDSAEIEQVSVIAALHRRSGANITEVLDRIADTARQRVEIRRELNGLTAQARLSRNILTALPVLVVLAIDIIGHDYERPLFNTTIGIVVLVIAALMVALGRWVMKQLVNIEE